MIDQKARPFPGVTRLVIILIIFTDISACESFQQYFSLKTQAKGHMCTCGLQKGIKRCSGDLKRSNIDVWGTLFLVINLSSLISLIMMISLIILVSLRLDLGTHLPTRNMFHPAVSPHSSSSSSLSSTSLSTWWWSDHHHHNFVQTRNLNIYKGGTRERVCGWVCTSVVVRREDNLFQARHALQCTGNPQPKATDFLVT